MTQVHKHGFWFQGKRMKLGMSQATLAKRVGVDRSYITQIESGNRWPAEPTLYRILAALGVGPRDAIETLGLVEDPDKARALRFVELVEAVGAEMTPAQNTELQELLSPDDDNSYRMLAQLAVAGGAAPSPDGWDRLDKEDRRLVQRIINRILDGYTDDTPEA